MTPRPVTVVWLHEGTWRSTVRAAAAVTLDADLVLVHTCFALARYNAEKCDFTRLNADAVDTAVLDALASFYRTHRQRFAQ